MFHLGRSDRTDAACFASAVARDRVRAPRLVIWISLLALCGLGSATPAAALAAGGKPVAFAVQATPSFKVLVPGQTMMITGRVRPSAPGQRVQLQASLRGHWRTISTTALSAKSGFRFAHKWRTLGNYRLRVLKAGTGRARLGASRTFSVQVARTMSARSSGHSVHLSLGAVSVSAPAGAIRAGQTLTVSAGGSNGAREGASSIVSGPYRVSTSQGEPRSPVTVTFTYDPALLGKGERPLFLHGLSNPSWWMPQATTLDAARHLASATLDSFSVMDVVSGGAYYGGIITGNRADPPSPCGQAPSWVHGTLAPDRNNAVMACFGTESNASQVVMHLVNNRGYAQMLQVNGALQPHFKPSWFSDTLESEAQVLFAKLTPKSGNQTFVLSPGGSVTISFDKPPSQPAAQYVYIDSVPRVASAAAEVSFALLSTGIDQIGLPLDVIDCTWAAAYTTFSSGRGQTSAIDQIHHCASAAAGFSTGAAKAAFTKLAWGLVADDFFTKLIDKEDQDAFPPQISFDVPGTNPTFTNHNIQLGASSFGSVPAGQQTIEHLSASGGTPPYSYHFYNLYPVPSWVTLAPDGTLTINPPAGDQHSYSFYTYAFDATNQHSPFARDTVTFQTNGAARGGGIVLGAADFGQISAGARTVEHLSASGGTGPYTYQFDSPAQVPAWVTLALDGTLTMTPPAGDNTFYSFYVHATDATNQQSPLARDAVTFQANGGGIRDLRSVSCPTPSFCAAVDGNGIDWSGHALTFNGASWSAPVNIDNSSLGSSHISSLDQVSCPTASFCVATDWVGNVLSFNGSSWSAPTNIYSVPPGSGDSGLPSVSCPTPSFCVAVSDNGSALTFNGSTWSAPVNIDSRGMTSVSCVSASFCVAVDGGHSAVTFNGSSWSTPTTIGVVGYGLGSVSCVSASFCVAVDNGGDVTRFNGSSWSSPVNIDNGDYLESVSCATSSFCVAVDVSGNAMTFNGSSWSSPANIAGVGGGFDQVSCPTASFCVAVDYKHGNVLSFDGSSWSMPTTIDPNSSG